jgi:hypothetical protein
MAWLFWIGRVFHFDFGSAGRAGQALRSFGPRRNGSFIHIINVGSFVHSKIRKPISQGVVMAKVMNEFDGIKIAGKGLGLIVKGFESGIFDAVFAEHLFDDEFTVAADLEFTGAELGGFAEADDEGHVFGDVVGGFADVSPDGYEWRGVFGGEDDADASQAGISAAAAVKAQGDGFFHCFILEGVGKQMQPRRRGEREGRREEIKGDLTLM